ncbi:PREDICTED: oral-facial-digital syndrome 1 protein-like [Ceratosolen solmsi marchali]|uniref:Oral-facial-digital syndrome 1 protein-like n=1 Tax=Ceratosolen solmsi marchali TaxID=326594 RepID=A0AAJ7DX00_9HYME|nr:PREDICTED: oral-facial-digital syndrome 1 protein-like [Ceratosolen solmsi marchali]
MESAMEADYSTVYSWFDKCGIISNIRTHLRYNLVKALRNKDLSKTFEKNTAKSAKQYIYDLLVADYLWNYNYVYTLSVFSSEAPLLINFNNVKCTQSGTDENHGKVKQKLQSDYVCHVLETLGIEPRKDRGQSILKDYAENDVPLLLCLLRQIKPTDINFSNENNERCEANNVEHRAMQTEEAENVVSKEKSKIIVAKKKLIQQKHLFSAQLQRKENKLKEQAAIMEEQLLMLQNKLDQAEKLIYNYNVKEKEFKDNIQQENMRILQRETELSTREKLLSQEANRLEKERDSYRHFESNLTKLQNELTKVKKEIPYADRTLNNNLKDAEVQTDFESFILSRNERNILSQEKQDLNGLVVEQQSRIEQLTSRVVYLLRKLEETQLRSHKVEMPSIIKVTNTNTIISENSSTEDILQDAKMRLRRLEEESIKADQYYFNFITNTSQ